MKMSDIEPRIKTQYAKFFQVGDWKVFKQLADHYLKVAAHLKKSDFDPEESNQLWFRNVQKRLFIGIGCELLLKSRYLHQGYGINTPKEGSWGLYRIRDVNPADYDNAITFSMNWLLDQLKNGPRFVQQDVIERGFRIAKVFRNKEGHVAVYRHEYDSQNFTDIESALKEFYREAFKQTLDIRISFGMDEEGRFCIQK
jgi:hypothetical protein